MFKAAKGLGATISLLVQSHPYRVSLILSLLASLLAIASRGLINSDGVYFLSIAKLIALQGVEQTVDQHHRLTFYSLFIYAGRELTGMSLQFIADVLNATLFAFASVAFTGILRSLKLSIFQVTLGVFLFALFPILNEIRADIYRDPGYYGFMLAALWCYLTPSIDRYFTKAALALLCVLMAALFRVEALFLLLFPLALFLSYQRPIFIGLALLLAVAILENIQDVFAAVANFLPQDLSTLSFFQKQLTIFLQFQQESLTLLREQTLSKHASKHAEGFYLFGSAYIFLAAIVSNLRWYILYLGMSNFVGKGRGWSRELLVAIALLSIPLFYQTYYGGFLQARYTVLICILMLALFVMHYGHLLQHASRWQKGLMAFFALVFFVDGFISTGPSRDFKKDAIVWIDHNLPAEATVISNQRGLSYSIDRLHQIEDGMRDDPMCSLVDTYDVYVYTSKKQIEQMPPCAENMTLLKSFANEKRSWAGIYSEKVKP